MLPVSFFMLQTRPTCNVPQRHEYREARKYSACSTEREWKSSYKSKVTLAIAWEQMRTPPSSSVLYFTIWMHTARQRQNVYRSGLSCFFIIMKNCRMDAIINLSLSLLRCQKTRLSFCILSSMFTQFPFSLLSSSIHFSSPALSSSSMSLSTTGKEMLL